MLRGLLGFGKEDKPPLPKGRIEVTCPVCGAVQYEPRLVVSTICKKCGEHLRVEKRRVVTSPVGSGIQPAAASIREVEVGAGEGPAEKDRPPEGGPAMVPQETKPLPSEAAEGQSRNVLKSIIGASEAGAGEGGEPQAGLGEHKGAFEPVAPADAFDASELGFGDMLKGTTAREEKPREEKPREAAPPPSPPVPVPPSPPASTTTFQKMKDQGLYRHQYFKEAQCFDCNHKFKVGRSCRSTSCPQCGAYISIEDVEITMTSTQAIKTRGDVVIRKHGHLSTSSVQCRDLRCYGLLEANVHCTGDAIFRTIGKIVGGVRCRRFVVEKGADVSFVNPIFADEVEIHARITGTILCRGPVLICTFGAVNGDVTARSVSIEPGGELNGAMNIIRSDSLLLTPPAPPAEKAPS